jgi:hypothetical protein
MADIQKLDPTRMIVESLKGMAATSLDRFAEDSWDLSFGPPRADLNIYCPWRLLSRDAVILGGSDHGQKFGLPQPVDVVAETLRILSGKAVQGARIDEITADLCIDFADGVRLDLFNDSGGYEGWTFADEHGLKLIAQGGGQIAIWKPSTIKS